MSENAAQRLKREGADVSKTDLLTVSVHDIHSPPREGSPLSTVWHPRSVLTPDDPGIARLVEEIVRDRGVNKPLLVREDWIRAPVPGHGATENAWVKDAAGWKRKVFTIVDGEGRRISALAAEPKLHALGLLHKAGVPVPLRVKVELFVGNDLALLKARQLADSDPSKRPHAPSVLAAMALQMFALGASVADVYATMPRYVLGSRIVEADVEGFKRWGLLTEAVVFGLDSGTIPFGLFRALLDVPRDEQFGRSEVLVEAGAKTMKGVGLVDGRARKAAEWEQSRDPAAVLADARKGATWKEPRDPAKVLADMSPAEVDKLAESSPAPLRRPHPKEMAAVIEGARGMGLDADEAVDTIEEPCDAYSMGVADGVLWALRYARAEATLDSFPNPEGHATAELVKQVKKALKAYRDGGKKVSK